MPIEMNFPQLKKEKELNQEQLESLLEIEIDPAVSLEDLLNTVKRGSFVKFIINQNYNLILSTKNHEMVIKDLEIGGDYDCLERHGNFKVISQKINFEYVHTMPRVKHIREAAENRIKLFLKSKGVEII